MLNFHLNVLLTIYSGKYWTDERKKKLNWAECPEIPANVAYLRQKKKKGK